MFYPLHPPALLSLLLVHPALTGYLRDCNGSHSLFLRSNLLQPHLSEQNYDGQISSHRVENASNASIDVFDLIVRLLRLLESFLVFAAAR